MAPNVDLVIVFKTSISLSKQQIRDDALKAEQQYSKLLETLTKVGMPLPLDVTRREAGSPAHSLVMPPEIASKFSVSRKVSVAFRPVYIHSRTT